MSWFSRRPLLGGIVAAALLLFAAAPVVGMLGGGYADPYFDSTVLILGDENGADGATTFSDKSSYHQTVTPVAAPVWSQALVPAGYASAILLRGSPWDAIRVSNHSSLDLGGTPLTIEAWALNHIAGGSGMIASKRQTNDAGCNNDNSWELHFNPSGSDMRAQFGGSSTGCLNDITGVGAGFPLGAYGSVLANQWNHFAVTWDGVGTWRGFTNGVMGFEYVQGVNCPTNKCNLSIATTTTPVTLGGRNDGTIVLNGMVAGVKITRALRYTANFTPPTRPYLMQYYRVADTTVAALHFDGANGSTTFTDDKGHTFTGSGNAQISTTGPKFATPCYPTCGKLLLDGTGDGVKALSDPNYYFAYGDFGVEGFINFASVTVPSATQTIFDNRPGATGNNFVLRITGGAYDFFANGSSRINGGVPAAGGWVHVALCRKTNVTRLFIDGVQVGSDYTDTNNYVQGPAAFGLSDSGGLGANASFDDWAVTKGACSRTGNFTPPAVPYSFLLHDNDNSPVWLDKVA